MKINIFDHQEFEPRSTCHVAGAVIGAAGSIGAGFMNANAAKAAAGQQAASQQAAMAMQLRMFNQARGMLQPYIDAGQGMLPQLQGWLDPSQSSGSPLSSLVKLTTPGANMNDTLSQMPGYQFSQTMGQKAVNNSLAARGLAGPGGALARGSADYATGLAQNTWQNEVNALMGTYQAGATGMQNYVNTGAGSAAALAGGATQTGGQIGQSLVGIGNAQAAGTLGSANAMSGMVNNLSQYGQMANMMGSMYGGGGGGNPGWSPSNAWYNNG